MSGYRGMTKTKNRIKNTVKPLKAKLGSSSLYFRNGNNSVENSIWINGNKG